MQLAHLKLSPDELILGNSSLNTTEAPAAPNLLFDSLCTHAQKRHPMRIIARRCSTSSGRSALEQSALDHVWGHLAQSPQLITAPSQP